MRRNVAVVGAGIGAAHLDGFRKLPQQFAVQTVCDLNTARAEQILLPEEQIRIASDLAVVLKDPEIDIVDICLPPSLHFATCRDVLQAGKHAICEKPLAASLHEADALAKLVQQTGKEIFPVFQYRYGLGTLQLKTLIAAGLTGQAYIATLETHWHRNKDYFAVDWRGTWRSELGGVILNHAIHMHDLLSFILGPVQSVFAELATMVNDIEAEDCAALSIRMASGALVTSSVTLGAASSTSRLRFCFEKLTAESGRSAYLPAEKAWGFTAREPYPQEQLDALLATLELPQSGYAGLFAAIADTLDGNPGNEVTLADARRSLEFTSAVYASFRSGLPVALPLADDHELYRGWLPQE